jgi:ABC-type branched-subunit amino acid transport system permease subunit
LGSHYSDIFAFIVLILVLTLRPSGCWVNVWPTAPEENTYESNQKYLRLCRCGWPAGSAARVAEFWQCLGAHHADMALLYVMLSLGLNIMVGYAGLLDLGYVAFFAVGAYMFGLMASPQLADTFHRSLRRVPSGASYPLWIVMPWRPALPVWLGMLLGAPTCVAWRLPGHCDAGFW